MDYGRGVSRCAAASVLVAALAIGGCGSGHSKTTSVTSTAAAQTTPTSGPKLTAAQSSSYDTACSDLPSDYGAIANSINRGSSQETFDQVVAYSITDIIGVELGANPAQKKSLGQAGALLGLTVSNHDLTFPQREQFLMKQMDSPPLSTLLKTAAAVCP